MARATTTPARRPALALSLVTATVSLVACVSAVSPAPSSSPGASDRASSGPTRSPVASPAPATNQPEPPTFEDDAWSDMAVDLELRLDCGLCGEDHVLWEPPIFRLYADGLALHRAPEPSSPYRYVQLPEHDRAELMHDALQEAGLRSADPVYRSDADDAGAMLFRAFDEDREIRVRLEDLGAASPERDRIAALGAMLKAFEAWLGERGLESRPFRPSAYLGLLGVTEPDAIGEAQPWPWTDVQPADFADTAPYEFRRARLTAEQAGAAGTPDGGGRFGTVTLDGGRASLYVVPVLPGDDLVGAYGLRPDSPAIAVTDGLRVRSLPEVSPDSKLLDPLLARGDGLYVVGGPVDGSGYRWYEVFAPRTGLGGWVAFASKDGEPWIESRPMRCTTAASDDPMVEAIGYSLMHLACYRDQTLGSRQVLAPVTDDGLRCPDVAPYWFDPDWLNRPLACSFEFRSESADTGLTDFVSGGVLHPSLAGLPEQLLAEAGDPTAGIVVDAVGRLDHPDARDCTTVGDEPLPAIRATLECRSMFVITSLEPVP